RRRAVGRVPGAARRLAPPRRGDGDPPPRVPRPPPQGPRQERGAGHDLEAPRPRGDRRLEVPAALLTGGRPRGPRPRTDHFVIVAWSSTVPSSRTAVIESVGPATSTTVTWCTDSDFAVKTLVPDV